MPGSKLYIAAPNHPALNEPLYANLAFAAADNFIAMADADPLGVDMNVTFDNVGGLDDREF